MTEFFNTLGDAGKMKWIDAIARSMGNSTDPQEINRSVFDKRYGSNDLDFNVEPVSYTHLDVYKRQLPYSFRKHPR